VYNLIKPTGLWSLFLFKKGFYMALPGGLLVESAYSAYVSQNQGYYSALPIQTTSTLTAGSAVVTGNLTVQGSVTQPALTATNAPLTTHTPVAINSTASATGAQVASGYITSTSASAVTITLPTSTVIATALGAVQGTVFDFYIDNTAGSNTVTLTVDASQVKSQVAQVATYGVPTFGLFTVASGTTGLACFRLVFSSATAASIARVF
jgi:hypothetical protein